MGETEDGVMYPQHSPRMLEEILDTQDYKVLEELLQRRIFDERPDIPWLMGSVEGVRARVRYVTELFYVNERIVIPERKISVVSFAPFEIMIGTLEGKKVKKIYEAHSLKMSLREAAKHAGVVASTVRDYWNRAELETHNPAWEKVSEEQKSKMKEAYEKRMSSLKAARHAGVSGPTFMAYLRKERLKPHYKPKTTLVEEKQAEIVALHGQGLNGRQTSEQIGVSETTTAKYLKKAGLKSNSQSGRELPQHQQDLIYEALSLDMSVHAAARHAGVARCTVREYGKRIGWTSGYDEEASRIPVENRIKIFEGYNLKMSISQIAEYSGASPWSVTNYLKRAGLNPHNPPGGMITISQEKQDKLKEAEELGMSIRKSAKYAGVSPKTVVRHRKKPTLDV